MINDAGKKIKGRKRRMMVDSQGFLLAVIVHSTAVQDQVSAPAVLIRLFMLFSTIRILFINSDYTGERINWARAMFA